MSDAAPPAIRVPPGWHDASDDRVSAWASDDGRFRVEKHPFARKYLVTDRRAFVDIATSLGYALVLAERERQWKA